MTPRCPRRHGMAHSCITVQRKRGYRVRRLQQFGACVAWVVCWLGLPLATLGEQNAHGPAVEVVRAWATRFSPCDTCSVTWERTMSLGGPGVKTGEYVRDEVLTFRWPASYKSQTRVPSGHGLNDEEWTGLVYAVNEDRGIDPSGRNVVVRAAGRESRNLGQGRLDRVWFTLHSQSPVLLALWLVSAEGAQWLTTYPPTPAPGGIVLQLPEGRRAYFEGTGSSCRLVKQELVDDKGRVISTEEFSDFRPVPAGAGREIALPHQRTLVFNSDAEGPITNKWELTQVSLCVPVPDAALTFKIPAPILAQYDHENAEWQRAHGEPAAVPGRDAPLPSLTPQHLPMQVWHGWYWTGFGALLVTAAGVIVVRARRRAG